MLWPVRGVAAPGKGTSSRAITTACVAGNTTDPVQNFIAERLGVLRTMVSSAGSKVAIVYVPATVNP